MWILIYLFPGFIIFRLYAAYLGDLRLQPYRKSLKDGVYSEGEGKTGKTGISIGALLPVISMTQKCGLLAWGRAVMCMASRCTIAAKRPRIIDVVAKRTLSVIKW